MYNNYHWYQTRAAEEVNGMDDAWLRMGYAKMAEEREKARRSSLFLEARRAKRQNAQISGPPFSGLRRLLGSTFGSVRAVAASMGPARHAR